MNSKLILILFQLLVGISFGLAQEMVFIKGEVVGDTEGYNKVYVIDDKAGRDSAVIHNGRFELKLPYKEGMEPYLFLEAYMRPGRIQEPFPLLINEPGTLYIRNIDLQQALYQARMVGMPAMVDYQVFLDRYFMLKDSLSNLLPEAISNIKELKRPLSMELKKYMEDYKSSYAAVYVLDKVKTQIEVSELQQLYRQLPEQQHLTEKGQEVSRYIENARFSEVGNDISALTYTDQEGQVKSLADFKGKYVLIDFWASWCGPCVKGFPHLQNLYTKYKSDRFEVLGISIDRKESEWVKAYEKYRLPWSNGIDKTEDMQNKLLVTAVPTLFLIDPEGRIILKEIGLTNRVDKELAIILDN